MQFSAPIPILRIAAAEPALAFYLGYLGFALDWEHRAGKNEPLYLQVSRAGLVLHLSEDPADAAEGAVVFVPVEGVATLHAELVARSTGGAGPTLQTMDWGVEMRLTDPFGNRLRFCERRSTLPEHAPPTVPGAPPPGYYRHTDGGLYQVVGVARDSRDASDVVLYDHVWPFEAGRWTRPVPEWASRFTPVTAEVVAADQRGDRAGRQAVISAARATRKG